MSLSFRPAGAVFLHFLLLVSLFCGDADAGEGEKADHFDARGLRLEPFRAPTPFSVPDAETLIWAEDLAALLKRDMVSVINVAPLTLSPPRYGEGQRVWLLDRRKSYRQIPGAIWLPEVGRNPPDPAVQAWFRQKLAVLTEGDFSRPLVFYCNIDCWMSWNAVQFARDFGYSRLYWYRDGGEGWSQAGFPLEEAEPEPFY